MKIEIEPDELLAILTGLNNSMFEKCRLIADSYHEQLQRNEDDSK